MLLRLWSSLCLTSDCRTFKSWGGITSASESGATQPRHSHESSEQIWYAVKGRGVLLLADNEEKLFEAGDVVRFGDGDIHGLHNDSDEEFIYISVTSPPIDFGYAYQKKG